MITLSRRLLPVSLHGQNKSFCLSLIFFLDQISKIKICHMVVKEHPEVIEGRRWLISMDVLDSEEATEDNYFDSDGAALDEEDESGLVGAGVT